ncbi:YraN family protein [Alkaliphilus hydrothermalis]|uniref:UPF0102 protein JOC73_000148 n=1 Tax=Alkaliphilus hydrothermalis TaxID=1482730 RepID=A0ABS2NL21_9FIRM|nr:YraN family protein [Alkaliphilus hydrothermalis]MBM7613640.1 putative endonuclease [Alkaliphilus hydrothermalis]
MKKQLGALGEAKSCAYLINEGYEILDRNYRTKFGEIDIVARKGDTVAFVEVKTRRSIGFGLPREAVNTRKQINYYRLGEYYIQTHRYLKSVSYRFDVMEVYKDGEDFRVEHIVNAF